MSKMFLLISLCCMSCIACAMHTNYASRAHQACQEGNRSLAISSYKLALKEDPNNTCLLLNLAICATNAEEYSTATEAIKRLEKITPDTYDFHHNYGALLYKTKDYHAARYHFILANSFQKKALDYHNLARIAENLGENGDDSWEIAYELYKIELLSSPDDGVIWCDYGIAATKAGHKSDAIAAYKRALELQPDYAKAQKNLMILLKKK